MNVTVLMPLARQLGGGELMFKQLVCHSEYVGITWHVIFFRDGPLVDEIRDFGIPTHVVKAGRLRQPLRFARTVQNIAKLLRDTESELVLSWSAKPHVYGSLAAKLAKIPATWYQLGSPQGVHLSFIDRLATVLPARFVFVLSEMGRNAQVRLWPKRRTALVYPGVDLSLFERTALPAQDEARKRLGLPLSIPIIGIVGRLQHWKGMHVLVRAMPTVLQHYPESICVIVGGSHDLEPAYEDQLKSSIGELSLDDHVKLVGFQRDIPLWMQAMDVVVHASDHEPFGIVVIEAMAIGKPVVASASGGPAEIIRDGENGLLVPFGEADRLAKSLLRYLDDPEFAKAIGKRAARRAQEFSLSAYVTGVSNAILQEN